MNKKFIVILTFFLTLSIIIFIVFKLVTYDIKNWRTEYCDQFKVIANDEGFQKFAYDWIHHVLYDEKIWQKNDYGVSVIYAEELSYPKLNGVGITKYIPTNDKSNVTIEMLTDSDKLIDYRNLDPKLVKKVLIGHGYRYIFEFKMNSLSAFSKELASINISCNGNIFPIKIADKL